MSMRRSLLTSRAALLLFFLPGCGGQSQERLEPVSYEASDRGNLIIINFPWADAGACVDQFMGTLEETETTVVVGSVIHSLTDDDCSDVSTDGKTFSVAEPLSAPIGTRSVVTRDGNPLPKR